MTQLTKDEIEAYQDACRAKLTEALEYAEAESTRLFLSHGGHPDEQVEDKDRLLTKIMFVRWLLDDMTMAKALCLDARAEAMQAALHVKGVEEHHRGVRGVVISL